MEMALPYGPSGFWRDFTSIVMHVLLCAALANDTELRGSVSGAASVVPDNIRHAGALSHSPYPTGVGWNV